MRTAAPVSRPLAWGFRIAVAALLLLASASAAAAQAHPRRVLLLYSYEREFAPHYTFAGLFRAELIRSSTEPIDFVEMSLGSLRFGEAVEEEAVVGRLRSAIDGQRFDLFVPIGGPAAAFAQKHRDALFQGTPMMLAAVDRRFVDGATLRAADAALPVEHDPSLIVDTILQLRPDTTTVLVVIGTSPLERFWLDEMKQAFQRFDGRLTFLWSNALSYAELLRQSAALPPRSAVFYALLSLDARGALHAEAPTLRALHAVTNAPMFGWSSAHMGRGIVGGPLLSSEDMSRNAAQVAQRILKGAVPYPLVSSTQHPGTPAFDERELRRWEIDEGRLPPGSVVEFREPTTWQRYRGAIVAGATVVSLQSVIVVALFVALARRRRHTRVLRASEEQLRAAQAALAGLSHSLMQEQESERARLARALHDRLCQRMTFLTMELHRFDESACDRSGETSTRVTALCDELADLTREMLALSDPVYFRLELIGLALSAKSHCAEAQAKHGVAVEFESEDVPDDVPKDVALALFRVLEQALRNALAHSAADRIRVSLRGYRSELQLDVSDTGRGFAPDAAVRGAGVGLVAMRERMHLVGGQCAIESEPDAGTRIRARAPLHREAAAIE